MSPGWTAAWLSLALTSACSPFGGGSFVCEQSSQCSQGSVAGMCQPNGFCSFDDSSCASGQRYGDLSGSVANSCVGGGQGSDSGGSDAIVPIDASVCFDGPLPFCLMTIPTAPRTLTGMIATDSQCDQVVTQTDNSSVCVVAATNLTVQDVRATGTRPLVLAASGTIEVSGTLDVSSQQGMPSGAGAPATECAMAMDGTANTGGGGGGAGGGFGGTGGNAGKGNNNIVGGTGGAVIVPVVVRGGCPGGIGGDGSTAMNGGVSGAAGGAVYLAALAQITIDTNGSVFASGAGGGAPGKEGGAGGGGTGGMIGFSAPTITVMGIVAANGGAGGGGGSSGQNGNPGSDGTTSMYNKQATHGSGGGGGDGGDGTDDANPDGGAGKNSTGGGGGGGGGIGVVWAHGTITGSKISPAPTTK